MEDNSLSRRFRCQLPCQLAASTSHLWCLVPMAAAAVEFTDADVARLRAKADLAAESLLKNARDPALNSDGQPWKLDFERPELRLRVFYSSVPGEKLYKFKATCELPGMRMEDMWAMLEDNTHRLTWDRNISDITHTRVRELPDGAGTLGIFRSATKNVGPISARDFVDVTVHRRVDANTMVSAGAGLETTAEAGGMYPPSKAFVRGYNHVGSGWYFERVPAADAADGVEGTRVAYIIMSDLKGWFPALVINNAIGGAYVTFFEDLQRALEARTGWKGRIKA